MAKQPKIVELEESCPECSGWLQLATTADQTGGDWAWRAFDQDPVHCPDCAAANAERMARREAEDLFTVLDEVAEEVAEDGVRVSYEEFRRQLLAGPKEDDDG